MSAFSASPLRLSPVNTSGNTNTSLLKRDTSNASILSTPEDVENVQAFSNHHLDVSNEKVSISVPPSLDSPDAMPNSQDSTPTHANTAASSSEVSVVDLSEPSLVDLVTPDNANTAITNNNRQRPYPQGARETAADAVDICSGPEPNQDNITNGNIHNTLAIDNSSNNIGIDFSDENSDDDYAVSEEEDVEETQPEQLSPASQARRDEEESMALARQLMAEEAMASYQMGAEYLRENADNFSGEDLAALQAAMQEENPENADLQEQIDNDGEEGENAELSYETMLQIGERIGNVKEERWALIAGQEIEKLRTSVYDEATFNNRDKQECDDSELKCLVCQCPYETGEKLRHLNFTCNHTFHAECVDEWLKRKDRCPYCSTCIIPEK